VGHPVVLPILICPDDRFPQGTSSASSAMIKEKKKLITLSVAYVN
jgi:hypothetical protein